MIISVAEGPDAGTRNRITKSIYPSSINSRVQYKCGSVTNRRSVGVVAGRRVHNIPPVSMLEDLYANEDINEAINDGP
jgi:hypothetical protein